MSFSAICTSCLRHLQKAGIRSWGLSSNQLIRQVPNQRAVSSLAHSATYAGALRLLTVNLSGIGSILKAKQQYRAISHHAEQKASVDFSPSIHLNLRLDSSNSVLNFRDGADLLHSLEVISGHLNDMTPKDVCLAVNKLWECIWMVRDDIQLWLEYSEILHNHPVLPQLCNLIQVHAAAMSNAEALSVLYLILKFAVPEVTSPAIDALYYTLSLKVQSFDLNDAAMFVRCCQSVKDVIPRFGVDCSEADAIMQSVLAHIQELLTDDLEYDVVPLPRLLLGLLHCSVDITHPAVSNIVQKVYRVIDVLDSIHLSPLSKAVIMMNRHHAPFAGLMTSRMSDILDDIHSPSDFSHCFYALITLCSGDLENRITQHCLKLFVAGASYGFNDIRRIMQGAVLMRSMENRDQIMTRVSQLLIPQVPAIPAIEMAIIYSNLRKVYSRNYELRELLEQQMKKQFLECSSPHQLLALIEVLSRDPEPDLMVELINKSAEIVPFLSLERLGRLCNAMGRMKVKSGRFLALIEDHVLENIDSLTNVTAIKNISHYLTTARSTNTQLQSICIERLHNILEKTPSPHIVVYTLDALSNLGVPCNDIDPSVWDKVLIFMPNLKGHDLRRVFFVLSSYSDQLYPRENLPKGLLNLLEFVRKPLYCTNLADPTNNKRAASKSLSASPILNASWIRDPASAVAFAKLLIQHRIYNKSFLAAIEATAQSQMNDISPFHVRDILDAFTFGNYHPTSPTFLEDLCASRVIPYMADLQPQRLVNIALSLAALQCFPLDLLQTIFSLCFLGSMEEMFVPRALSHQLRELNRAVCLECPELRVPWFSSEQMSGSGKPQVHGIKLDVGSVLQDVLGGPAFLRRNAQTPYANTNDFECILDYQGQPVTYTSQRQVDKLEMNGKRNTFPSSSDILKREKHQEGLLQDGAQRIAIDVIRPSQMCSNITRYSSWVEMKRRHLEILGYEYITIPYMDWSRDHLNSFEAKRLYISELLGGNLWLSATENQDAGRPGPGPGPGSRPRKTGRTNDMVDRMLQDWGEQEEN
ncbi:FAST kinase domain-containing protein 1, mitochondrial [Strongylocentrotus purpuratus]|uniref:RAP domain-containing protein n=1 Tax=Strongylocentrotus purpuratus TaxID=7668 RepID=A0A7M7REP3_STRPU|nr:FAST kinase domain-containing protein 1, mitochondrial [Strongylocentrotus purpuratus]